MEQLSKTTQQSIQTKDLPFRSDKFADRILNTTFQTNLFRLLLIENFHCIWTLFSFEEKHISCSINRFSALFRSQVENEQLYTIVNTEIENRKRPAYTVIGTGQRLRRNTTKMSQYGGLIYICQCLCK